MKTQQKIRWKWMPAFMAIFLLLVSPASAQTRKKQAAGKQKPAISQKHARAARSSAIPLDAANDNLPPPRFSSDVTNKALADLKVLMDAYTLALQQNNVAEITRIGNEFTAWAQETANWVQELKPEELQSFSEYMMRVSNAWAEVATKYADEATKADESVAPANVEVITE